MTFSGLRSLCASLSLRLPEPRAWRESDRKGGLAFGELITDGRTLLLVGSDGRPSRIDSLSLLWHAYWTSAPLGGLSPEEVFAAYDSYAEK